jgi:Zn finger protein HypA/HybF involved in hydrogenase expression
MKKYIAIEANVLRGTMKTAAIADLKEECVVFVEQKSVATRCFRCLGNIFRTLDKPDTVACDYCHAEYQTK